MWVARLHHRWEVAIMLGADDEPCLADHFTFWIKVAVVAIIVIAAIY